jgi:hypothetical protein
MPALVHSPDAEGRPLCGGLHATLLDPRHGHVTCPICCAFLVGQQVVLGVLGAGQRALTARLHEAQARPEAQALGRFMRLVIQARRATTPERK